ncbi:hypothetical protein A3C26_01365 [Candidatus Daviesbacteria bacterium RIFCSPHIGHO2_02_FULL_39_12]|uniref:O-antigen ligase-related domain-containing protein n=2 Tax=Candidatus Daviesiibacteriota TaxID=1752718 RepID=A0A1F5JC02_9BACT|nr:MAG: hypothetical protein A3C26_01365 [Candidatus Daviesbacteria bacterium RIFCSPHIGHO2_02_FULL_39_12]OGE72010.1 MAG: hypothetical protein A3H40_00515 [Candidatus Daviesbacteria bacterium RIFCSPLOWO2_02_FULL_38_15]
MSFVTLILTLAILSGQLIKIPLLPQGGLTVLDFTVISLVFFGLIKLKLRLKSPPFFIKTALFFITVCLISLAITPLSLNLSQYLISVSYTLRLLFYIILGWLIYLEAFPKLKDQIPQIVCYSSLSLSIIGILQFIFVPDLRFLQKDLWDPHYFRAVSTLLDPNFLGAFLVLSLLTTFNTKISPALKKYSLLIIFIALLTTFSRGSYLSFLLTFSTFSLCKKSVKQIFVTLLLFVILLTGFNIYQKAVAEPRGVDKAKSAENRLGTWQQGLTLFQHHPILGTGFNAYKFALKQNNLANDQFLQSRGATSNDSSLLHVASTTGVIGLITYIFFLFSLFLTGWKNKTNPYGLVLISGLVGLLAQSFFINNLFYPFIFLWIILIAARVPVLKGQKK